VKGCGEGWWKSGDEKAGGLVTHPPVATRFSRFRQFVDRFRRNPVKIHRKIGKNFPEKNKVTNSGGTTGEGGERLLS
jgi:hypothetical protein